MKRYFNFSFLKSKKESYFKAMEHLEAYHTLSEGQDWALHSTFDDLDKSARARIEKIRQENVEAFLQDKYLEESAYSMFVDSCVHLQRLYRIIANRYAKDVDEKIEYLKKVFEVCKKSKLKTLESLVLNFKFKL